ncbi:MAG: UDP-3-O-(3-hydroxymyristoyl)glucosamine N-acyltransferase [Acidobacteria bacterium]|nr:UDP-3-O-(3-hydroxymyristoyl)glucosamine N-acyltransferase [Acidobacteriota bacterium]
MRLSEIARLTGCEHVGEDCGIVGVSDLKQPEPGTIAYADSTVNVRRLLASPVAALLVGPGSACEGKPHLRAANPRLALARLLGCFQRPSSLRKEVYPGAYVEEGAKIGRDVAILPFACVMAGAEIGDGSELHAGVYVGPNARVGKGCVLKAGVVVGDGVVLGDRVIAHPNAVIGGDGFGYAPDGATLVKIPQIGTIEVGDDAEIGACTTIDRATLGRTVIGKGTKIDNLVQIGHNVTVGENTVIISQVGIAGSTRIGNSCILAGQAGITDHAVIEDRVVIGAMAGIESKHVKAGSVLLGAPARDHMETKRIFACFPRLPDLLKRVAALEQKLRELEGESSGRTDLESPAADREHRVL